MFSHAFSHKIRAVCWVLVILLQGLALYGCGSKKQPANCQAEYRAGGYHHLFKRSFIDMLHQVRSDIMASANVRADFRIIADPDPNAFMAVLENEPTVILTTGILELIGDAKDEYAFLIAHECAHLRQDHLKGRKEAQDRINRAGSAIITGIEFLGLAVGLPLGLFSLASVESGSHLTSLKYDRDQEREADRLALTYMKAAGYDIHGALSFHEKIRALSKGPAISILSTHPPDEERLEAIRAMISKKNSPPIPPEKKERP